MIIRRKDDIVFPVYKRTSSRLLAEFRARKHVTDGRYVPLASPRGSDSPPVQFDSDRSEAMSSRRQNGLDDGL
jgi:hypothetical protein